jgi:LPXTG-motif cell wall-anchored protein
MKKALAAFGVLSAALVLLVAPVSAQTPGDITATITTAPATPTAGAPVNATTVFSIPALSGTSAQVSVTSSAGPITLVSFTPGLSSCLTTATSVTCTWSTPDSAAPQTIVISVPGAGTSMTFTAAAGAAGSLTQKATATVTVGQATTTTVAGSTTTTAASTTTTAATTTVAPPPTEAPTTVAPTTTASGSLPATGSNSNAPLIIAIVAIGLGALLLGATRLVRSRS